MKGWNCVQLLGNLGSDPDLRVLKGNVVVAQLAVATSEMFRLRDGNLQMDTQWHRVILWRSLAELAGKYLKKGSKVYLEGRLRTRSYEEKSGLRRYVTEIIRDKLIMLDRKVPVKDGSDTDSLNDALPF